MTNNSSFDYVIDNGLCLGCAACTQIETGSKVSVHIDETGFIRPRLTQRLTEDEDQAFSEICPGLTVRHEQKGSHWTDLWGPVVSSHVGWAKDRDTRFGGSSGGGITASISYLLDKKLVDAVLHVGVSAEGPLINTYKISTTSAEAKANTGSRYAPAAPLEGLSAILSKYSRVAVVGKPCDIVAARNLAKHSREVGEKLKYFISFMCAGVPSFKGTDAVLNLLEVKKGELKTFRYRGNGWPGYATATLDSGETKTMSYHDSWGRVLNKHLQLRCKVCIDGTGEFADITFADAWYGGDEGYPDFEEKEGRSLVLVRTEVGRSLFEGALQAEYLESESLPLSDVEKMQPYQAIRKKLMLSRVLAMRLFGLKPPRYDFGNMSKLAMGAGIKKNVISFLGMARRALVLSRGSR